MNSIPMDTLSIYIATGTPMDTLPPPGYISLLVGEHDGEFPESKILRDTVGDSIAAKNPHYCELTGLYWIWKNAPHTKYVGLCHYRRFFWLANPSPRWGMKTVRPQDLPELIDASHIEALMSGYDAILPRPQFHAYSIEREYGLAHHLEDLHTCERIIAERYPGMVSAMHRALNSNRLYYCNMFILPWDTFQAYMQWLFDVLFRAEREIRIDENDHYQRRVFGFLAERLLNVYAEAQGWHIHELPLLFTGQPAQQWKNNWCYKLKKQQRMLWGFQRWADVKVIIKTYMPIIYKIYKRCRK